MQVAGGVCFIKWGDYDERFFEKLCERYHFKSILDCACGTGQHLYLFSEIGIKKVCGSDYSQSMLDMAKRNLDKLGKTSPVCRCHYRTEVSADVSFRKIKVSVLGGYQEKGNEKGNEKGQEKKLYISFAFPL